MLNKVVKHDEQRLKHLLTGFHHAFYGDDDELECVYDGVYENE
jgi:hypothetical protein